MSRRLEPLDTDHAWRSRKGAAAPTTPSWLAPPLESQTFVVARAVTPLPEPPSQPEKVQDEAPAAIAATDSQELAYPDLREENVALRDRVAGLDDQLAAVHRQLEAQAVAFSELRRGVLLASEPELVRLACVIAERITRRELTLDPTLAVAWAREALEALGTAEPPLLALAPDLAALLDEPTLRKALPGLARVEVDATLSAMRCEVRTRSSRVDASLEARLGSIADDLGVAQE